MLLSVVVAFACGISYSHAEQFLLATPTTSRALATVEERAQCQCSVDGKSGFTDVLYWERFRKTYPTENIEYSGEYKFIGCGAHKFYRDKAENQIAGYPWRFCYTYGGRRGCKVTPTSRKYSLNSDIAYRFCNGDYDCGPQARTKVENGTIVATKVLGDFDSDGYLQDWTNCCRSCRLESKCSYWDFSVESMTCRLFSTVDQVTQTEDLDSSAPYWYYGTPGFDDSPAECWFRNEFETCKDNFMILFVVSLTLTSIGAFFVCLDGAQQRRRYNDLGWTDDVTPGHTRTVTRTASSKHGSRSYNVNIYSATIVYRVNNNVRRVLKTREGRPFQQNQKLYFHSTTEDRIQIIGNSDNVCGCGVTCCLITLAPGLLCLLILSLQVVLTDGGQFQARYVLPGSANRVVWVFVLSIVATALVVSLPLVIILDSRLRKRDCKPENRYTRENPIAAST